MYMARMSPGIVSCAKDIGDCWPLELATKQVYSGCTITDLVMKVVHAPACGLSVQTQHTHAKVR